MLQQFPLHAHKMQTLKELKEQKAGLNPLLPQKTIPLNYFEEMKIAIDSEFDSNQENDSPEKWF